MAKHLGMIVAIVLAVIAGGYGLIRFAGAGATVFQLEGAVLHISGPISGAASDRLQRFLEENDEIALVSLGDIPGADDVGWAAGMGRVIRASGVDTQAAGPIVNDAILIYLGGVERRVADAGTFVFQSDALQQTTGIAVDQSPAAQSDRERLVTTMLGNPDFAAFMAEMRASTDFYILTEDDIAAFGLQTEIN